MAKDTEFYLSKGMSKAMAEYYASGRKRIIAVAPNDDFTLTLDFDNGERRLYDCKPMLRPGTVFEPFMRLDNFRRVYIDSEHCIAWDIDPEVDSEIEWTNKVDICPDSCYVDSVPVQGSGNDARCL